MAKEFFNALEAEIAKQDMGNHPKELYEPIQYLMSLGGMDGMSSGKSR